MNINNMENVGKEAINSAGYIERAALAVPKKIEKAVNRSARTVDIMFTDKAIRNRIIGVIKKLADLTDSTKKSIQEVGTTFKKEIIDNADTVKRKVRTVMSAPKNIRKRIKVSAKAMNILLTDKAVRDEITEIIKKTSDLTKKSIDEAGETVLKDRVFIDNLKRTSDKIGTQVSSAVYSTVDGLSIGIVSDVQAIYSSFLTTLNTVNLLSSILKLPIDKINEKLKGDSKDIISLIQSLKSIQTNYENLVERLGKKYNNAIRLNGPKDNTISPKDNSISPKDNTISPKDNAISPKDNTISPKDGTIESKIGGGLVSRVSAKNKLRVGRLKTITKKSRNKNRRRVKTRKEIKRRTL